MSSSSAAVPVLIKQQVTTAIMHRLSDAVSGRIDDATVTTVKAVTIKVTSSAVSSPVAAKVAAMLLDFMAVHLKVILVKLLSSAAFKTMIAAKIKAIVAGTIVATAAHVIVAKMGIGAGAAFAIIILPLLIAFIAYEAATFPSKLAAKISCKIRMELSGKFEEINSDIIESMIHHSLGTGISIMANQLLSQTGIQVDIEKLVEDFSGASINH